MLFYMLSYIVPLIEFNSYKQKFLHPCELGMDIGKLRYLSQYKGDDTTYCDTMSKTKYCDFLKVNLTLRKTVAAFENSPRHFILKKTFSFIKFIISHTCNFITNITVITVPI